MKYLRLWLALAGLFYCSVASAQTAGTVTNHALPIGKGAGTQGYGSLLLGAGQIAIGQTSADPTANTPSGDVTMSATGVTAIGSNKVTNTQIRQSGALALVGRSANTTGNVADIQATAGSSCAFIESASTLICGQLATAGIANNAVTNAKLATMAALTLKGNATAGSAAPTDIDVTALTSKASPISGDIVLIQDSAASNAFKKTTVGALSSAGSVASIDGATGAFTIGGLLSRAINLLQVLAAGKSDQQTPVSAVLAVTPLHQQDHDSAAKAWVTLTGSTGASLSNYNIASIVRNSTGNYTITFTTAFASANYACLLTAATSGSGAFVGMISSKLAGSITVFFNNVSNTPVDPITADIGCFGRE